MRSAKRAKGRRRFRREERRRIRRRRKLRLKAALLGRSRGGQTSKVHLAADRRCRPLAFVLTAGQAADGPQFIPVLDKVRIHGPVGHDAELYKERNTVERLINKLKAWRGIATRYDKTPESYLAGLHLRASVIWIKDLTRMRAESRAGHRGT